MIESYLQIINWHKARRSTVWLDLKKFLPKLLLFQKFKNVMEYVWLHHFQKDFYNRRRRASHFYKCLVAKAKSYSRMKDGKHQRYNEFITVDNFKKINIYCGFPTPSPYTLITSMKLEPPIIFINYLFAFITHQQKKIAMLSVQQM